MQRFAFAIASLFLASCTTDLNESLAKAVSRCDIAEIEAALGRGADINFVNKEGYDALAIATMRDKPACVRVLLKRGANIRFTKTVMSAPEIAASMGHNEVLAVFFESGFPPNWQGPSGRTLLHAAAEGQDKTAQFLLDKGVPVDGNQRDGDTPLFLAVGMNYGNVVNVLLAAGANPNVKDKYGNCPLTMALAENREDIAKQLIAYGAKKCR